MSAIARLLLARGARVTGSDVQRTALVDEIEQEGASVAIGHRAENVGNADVVVVSSAIAKDNPEFVAAIERQIDIVTRGAMLAQLTSAQKTIAIAGTHGKTTTTAMTALILEAAGLDPTSAIGGVRVDSGSNAHFGSGAWFVTESDESDGSFLHLQPTIAVVTNVENDHLSSDDELPTEIAYAGLGSSFTLVEHGGALGQMHLRVPGEINIQNALAAIGVARALKIDVPTIALALAQFAGVRRRFEIVGRRGNVVVVDDYAHHPTAIAQTIAAARGYTDAPIVVAFQPHRYSRTRYLAADFARALDTADKVILAPIYAASEAPIPRVSERSIGELMNPKTPVRYVADVAALLDVVPVVAGSRALVLMLGAGSISGVAHRLGAALNAAPAVVP
jgi:UDP-N-acetylmuramate--alanine ligase